MWKTISGGTLNVLPKRGLFQINHVGRNHLLPRLSAGETPSHCFPHEQKHVNGETLRSAGPPPPVSQISCNETTHEANMAAAVSLAVEMWSPAGDGISEGETCWWSCCSAGPDPVLIHHASSRLETSLLTSEPWVYLGLLWWPHVVLGYISYQTDRGVMIRLRRRDPTGKIRFIIILNH